MFDRDFYVIQIHDKTVVLNRYTSPLAIFSPSSIGFSPQFEVRPPPKGPLAGPDIRDAMRPAEHTLASDPSEVPTDGQL